MSRKRLKDALGWGTALWAFGYVLGIVSFAVVPPSLIGWLILPLGLVVSLWVLFTRVEAGSMRDYAAIAAAWTAIAVVFDYLFIVKAFNPPDGYYKADVYLYYVLTFVLPLAVGVRRSRLQRPAA